MGKEFGRPDSDLPTRLPRASQEESYLVNETFLMEQQRREREQQGHRQLAKVNVVEHEEPRQAAEGALQNNIKQHPWVDSQRFDGIDPNENPEPALNTEARKEFDNAKREQELEYKMRLGLMPKMGSTPEFKP